MAKTAWKALGAVTRLALAASAALAPAAWAQEAEAGSQAVESGKVWSFSGEWQSRAASSQAARQGPLAQAQAIEPGIVSMTSRNSATQLELRNEWKLAGISLGSNLLLLQEWPSQGSSKGRADVNEFQASGGSDSWQWSLGRKIVSWDVAYAFRPNDLVQQEMRRSLLGSTPQGRPLAQLEWFDAERSASLVWVNPRREEETGMSHLGTDEGALAARYFQRLGNADAYLFARQGRSTGSSLGTAFSWVPGDAWELHASARWIHAHHGWLGPGSHSNLVSSNPWQLTRLGSASQWLMGLQWTGEAQQSLMLEAWHDGTAPSRSAWQAWQSRNQALSDFYSHLPPAMATPLAGAVAGNLAWQSSPLDTSTTASSLRQQNIYMRLNWQPTSLGMESYLSGTWQFTWDRLVHPEDGGHLSTWSAQYQGDRWRLNAAWRQTGGARASVLAQLPSRRSAVLAATLSF